MVLYVFSKLSDPTTLSYMFAYLYDFANSGIAQDQKTLKVRATTASDGVPNARMALSSHRPTPKHSLLSQYSLRSFVIGFRGWARVHYNGR